MAGKGINYPLVISGVVCQLGAGIMYTLKSTKASTIEQVLRLGGIYFRLYIQSLIIFNNNNNNKTII